MAHTPGPWVPIAMLSGSENDRGWRVWAPDDRDGQTWIADVSPVIDNDRGDASEMGKANARLIVAAPGLLSVLKEVEWTCADVNDSDGARFCPSCGGHEPDCGCDDCMDEDQMGTGHVPACKLQAAIREAEGGESPQR